MSLVEGPSHAPPSATSHCLVDEGLRATYETDWDASIRETTLRPWSVQVRRS